MSDVRECWAVWVPDRGDGKPAVGPGRYPTIEGVDFAVAALSAKFGDRNFRAVPAGADESSEDIENRLMMGKSAGAGLGGTAPAQHSAEERPGLRRMGKILIYRDKENPGTARLLIQDEVGGTIYMSSADGIVAAMAKLADWVEGGAIVV